MPRDCNRRNHSNSCNRILQGHGFVSLMLPLSSLAIQRVISSILDQCGNFLWMRLIDRVAGASHLDGVAVRTLGVHALQIGVDGSVPKNVPNGAWAVCRRGPLDTKKPAKLSAMRVYIGGP